LFKESDISSIIEESFIKLMMEEEIYTSRGSGFTLQAIDGLLLAVYKYTPMCASSYISLPAFIDRKRATINPQNNDQQCFKWSILAKHVTGENKFRIGENYRQHEDKYNFNGLSFPKPLSDITKFEKNNQNVSVNVYGLDKNFQPPLKYPTYEVFPLRITDTEKPNHFDLLLVTDDSGSHYIYISNLSRLVSTQKSRHQHSVYFCKRCFASFDDQILKYKLNGRAGLEQHKLICGAHKPNLPKLPAPGTMLEFKTWKNTQRHPIVIYADFEALLVKCNESKGKNTSAFQNHVPMSYGFIVKANDDIPIELLETFGIPTTPIIFRGSENKQEVAKHFLQSIVEIAEKIEKLLKTNTPIIMTPKLRRIHELCKICNLCKNGFSVENDKVADHCHLSGKFRQTICNTCNLKLQTPNFVPCFFHNLSNYDAHFIVTELGYDTKSISVIPNTEEKYISFTKYITKKFSVRFINTFRFLASSLSTLSSNLITPGFEKFWEIFLKSF